MEVVTLDLDVLAAQRVPGNGGGDLEQGQGAQLGLEDQITGAAERGSSRRLLVEQRLLHASASTVFLLAVAVASR